MRDYRDHVPGSRLTARTVAIFGALVVAPLLIVYLFSLEFLNRGIDSWFRVEVKQGLSDALVLSRAALDVRMREYSQRTERLARIARRDAPARASRDASTTSAAAERRARDRACSASTSASSPRASRIRWRRCRRARRRIWCGR